MHVKNSPSESWASTLRDLQRPHFTRNTAQKNGAGTDGLQIAADWNNHSTIERRGDSRDFTRSSSLIFGASHSDSGDWLTHGVLDVVGTFSEASFWRLYQFYNESRIIGVNIEGDSPYKSIESEETSGRSNEIYCSIALGYTLVTSIDVAHTLGLELISFG